MKKTNVKLLNQQGFVFVEAKDGVFHFKKDDLHFRIAYMEYGSLCIGMEICRGEEIRSKMLDVAQEKRKDSVEQMITDTITDIKKIYSDWKEEKKA